MPVDQLRNRLLRASMAVICSAAVFSSMSENCIFAAPSLICDLGAPGELRDVLTFLSSLNFCGENDSLVIWDFVVVLFDVNNVSDKVRLLTKF
jgi:hypothetical protein